MRLRSGTRAFWYRCVFRNKPQMPHRELLATYRLVVWWATAIEMHSALARIARMGLLSPDQYGEAKQRAEDLRKSWTEVQPSEAVRKLAEIMLDRFPLRAADSLQLAAALAWCRERPRERSFLCADKQLLEAARRTGFNTVEI